MDTIKYTIHFFVLALGIGTYLFSPLVNTKLTGVGFLKLVMNILIGTLTISFCVGFFIEPFFTPLTYILYGASLLLSLSIMKFHQDESTGLMNLSRFLLSLLLLCLSYTFHQSLESFAFFLLTTLFLGICNYTMVLGHYYLVVPKLTEKPLLVSLKILWVFLVLKIILSGYEYSQLSEFFKPGSLLGYGYIFNWIVLSMRVLWGFVALGVLSFFGYRLSAMRSIQSATGVFYVMVFFIFIGELISIYSFYGLGTML